MVEVFNYLGGKKPVEKFNYSPKLASLATGDDDQLKVVARSQPGRMNLYWVSAELELVR